MDSFAVSAHTVSAWEQWLQCSAKLTLNWFLSMINYPTLNFMLTHLDCYRHPNKLAKIFVHCVSTVLHWKNAELSCFEKYLPGEK